MVTIKTEEEIKILREGGKRLAAILKRLSKEVKIGVSASSLNILAEKLAREGGDAPSFLNYRPRGSKRSFPASLCVSINDEVVHGIPNESEKIIQDGDIVSIDMGLIHKGLYTDSALTLPVGNVDEKGRRLIEITQQALERAITVARAGNYTGDIGFAVESFVQKHGFGIVRELAGHGVGYSVHEDPYIPNYGKAGTGVKLERGMVLALEPMLNEGGDSIKVGADKFTIYTADGKRSAHFEHTILVTNGDAEVLTARG